MVQRLTYRRRLPCTAPIPISVYWLIRQYSLKSYPSHQDTRRKATILAHQKTRQRSSMWWLWHYTSRCTFLLPSLSSCFASLSLASNSVRICDESRLTAFISLYFLELRLTIRFPPFVPRNTPVLPRMRRQYNVPTVDLAVQTVSRIGLCGHSLLRNRSWWSGWLNKRPPPNRMAITFPSGGIL